MAAVDLPVPRRSGGMAADLGVPGSAGLVEVGSFSLRVLDAGLACCAVEVSAALRRCAELLTDGDSGPGEGSDLGTSAGLGEGSGPAEGPEPGSGEGPGPAEGSGPDGGPSPVNVLVVAGTVTDKLAPLVLAAYRDLPEPRRVLSFGACSNSGGPYWDSYCVTKGADQLIPVDVYVPGCPPRPEALVHGLRLLLSAAGDRP